jgi:hypothetical protein
MQYTRFIYFSVLACFLVATAGLSARSADRDIYPPPTQAAADIAEAIKSAAAAHKRGYGFEIGSRGNPSGASARK